VPELTVVIPAHNEAPVIGRVLDGLSAAGLVDCEVIVVDDGSSDDTAEVAARHGARVIRHPYNMGNGAAVKSGLRAARGRVVVLMDGDGQHDAREIADLVRETERYHMVVGARESSGQAGWHRLLANRLYNWFASYVGQFPVRDLTSGFRALRSDEARRFIELLPNTFSYPTTLTLAFLRSGLSVKYVPITCTARVGRSKIRLWEDGTRFLLIILKIATLFAPFRVFLPVSAFFFLSGSVYYLYTFVTEHRFTNMAALLLVTSVIIFMMGLVSEQIALLRMERLSDLPASDDELPAG
jgi:glycosyltransferase involved in cell wall biosynthesis